MQLQGISAVGNWLFNFALGLFVPPGFANITWKLFIVFGVLCVGAAIQVFFTYVPPSQTQSIGLYLTIHSPSRYPETCGKTLEEIEEMFNKGGPRPWHTKPGNSKLDALIEEAREKHLELKDVVEGGAMHHESVPVESKVEV